MCAALYVKFNRISQEEDAITERDDNFLLWLLIKMELSCTFIYELSLVNCHFNGPAPVPGSLSTVLESTWTALHDNGNR